MQEILVGLEFRVSLERYTETGKRTGKGLVGSDLLVNRVRIHGGSTGSSHLVKSLLFVRGIALHGIHELRHQVKALLELHVDVGEGILAVVTEFHQAVVHGDEPDNENDCDYSNNNERCHENSFDNRFKKKVYNFSRRIIYLVKKTEILTCARISE